jgi:hypothetical protein
MIDGNTTRVIKLEGNLENVFRKDAFVFHGKKITTLPSNKQVPVTTIPVVWFPTSWTGNDRRG